MAWEDLPPPSETRPRDLLADVGRAQRAVKLLIGPFLRWYVSMEVTGAEDVPGDGPAILAPNHESMWDVPLLAVASPRPVVFMAKEEVFSGPIKSRFFTLLGGFPVRRGGRDFDAMRRSLAAVRSGRVLCLYPEGTRHRGAELGPFLSGAAWIALAEGVPLVPVGILGTDEIWSPGSLVPRRAAVRVAFGEPIRVERARRPAARRTRADELTMELRNRVAALLA
ncbi:MAG TPA: lysophospholipid acyltransferase family protein [Actinomycetota bacterium]